MVQGLMRGLRRVSGGLLLALVSGCSLNPPTGEQALGAGTALTVLSNKYLTLPALGGALLVYGVVDPLAPNWSIQETRLADGHYSLSMRLRSLHSGGTGEARQVFLRRAAQLGHGTGFEGYRILAWEEGVESGRPFAQRVAYGEVRLVPRPEPALIMPDIPTLPPPEGVEVKPVRME
jgi:hypothetical protein